MNKVLILHGWGGSDHPHWQSLLACELAKDYGCVNFFKFSNIDLPDKDTWLDELHTQMMEFKPDIVLCHSIANILWFHLCNETKFEDIKKLYLVAPPSLECDIKELSSFFPCTVPSNLHTKEAILITSTNDPYMTHNEANALQKTLNIPMKVLENAGHINSAGGYGEWPWILQNIKQYR